MKYWLSLTLIALSSQTFALTEPESYDALQNYEDKTCTEKYTTGNYATAIPTCERAARKGDPAAQAVVGLMHFYGHGVITNNDKAAQWFRQAAANGNAEGQFYLGRMYSSGLSVPQDDVQAFDLFLASAKQGYWEAQWVVSMAYRLGIGAPKDMGLAYEWYQSAIKTGLKNAPEKTRDDFSIRTHKMNSSHPGHEAYLRGMDAMLGIQGDPNPTEALPWFHQAAELNHPEAQFNLGLMYFEGDGVEKDDIKSLEWFFKAAENDHRDAQAYLAWMYHLGIGTAHDRNAAISWFSESLEPDAQTKKAQAKQKAKQLVKGSFEWNQVHAKKGDPEAQTALGMMYLHGKNVEKDTRKGFQWINAAAEQGYPPAEYRLGLLYMEGEGTIQNTQRGIEWLRRAASHNHPEAQFELGLLFENGRYVRKSLTQAYAWYNLAAGQDLTEAHTARNKVMSNMSQAEIQSAQGLSRELYQQLKQ